MLFRSDAQTSKRYITRSPLLPVQLAISDPQLISCGVWLTEHNRHPGLDRNRGERPNDFCW